MKVAGLVLFAILAILNAVNASQHQIEVELVTNWKQTPLYLEIGEFIATQDQSSYWTYLDEIAKIEVAAIQSEEEQYLSCMKIAEAMLSQSQLMMLKYSLSLRYFSPKVQMFKQLSSGLQTKCNGAFVEINGQSLCTVEELQAVLKSLENIGSIPVYPGDHQYGKLTHAIGVQSVSSPILYAAAGTKEFAAFSAVLKAHADASRTSYVFRYLVPESSEPVHLAGYGVELAIKSLEYKVIDDSQVEGASTTAKAVTIEKNETDVAGILFGTLQDRKPHLSSELANFKSFLLSQDEKFEDLKVWNLKDLGYQAVQRIASASDPLKLLTDISQNFPTYAVALSKVETNETLKNQMKLNSQFIQRSSLLLNGKLVDLDTTEPFQLYPMIEEEMKKFQSLSKLGISDEIITEFLSTPVSSNNNEVRFAVNGDFITYLNNLEKDPQYRGFGKSVRDLLRPAWPGSFRYVGKNLVNVIFVMNFDNPTSLQASVFLDNVMRQNAPIRFGYIFTSNSMTSVGASAFRIAKYLQNKYGNIVLNSFCASLFQNTRSFELNEDVLLEAFKYAIIRVSHANEPNAAGTVAMLAQDGDYDEILASANEYVKKLGIKETPALFINGISAPCSGVDETYSSIVNEYFKQIAWVQTLVANGILTDSIDDLYAEILQQGSSYSRFNGQIIVPKAALTFVSLTEAPAEHHEFLKGLTYYAHPHDINLVSQITHLIVTDLTTVEGVNLALAALNSIPEEQSLPKFRFGLIFNSKSSNLLERAIVAAQDLIMAKRVRFVKALLSAAQSQELTTESILKIAEENGVSSSYSSKLSSAQVPVEHQKFVQGFLDLPVGQLAVYTNGRLIALEPQNVFVEDDFTLLTNVEISRVAGVAYTKISALPLAESMSTEDISHLVATLSSMLGSELSSDVEKTFYPPDAIPSIHIPGENKAFSMKVALNPISVQAQRFIPMLQRIAENFQVSVTVYFTPVEYTNLPLKNYYQYVLPKISFENGKLKKPTALFTHPPPQRLLTLNLDVPPAWLVTPIEAVYDMDNLRLKDIPAGTVSAKFELQHLVIEGNCYDISIHNSRGAVPPRGTQVVINPVGNGEQTRYYGKKDTLVMANLGYFQLKGNPGFWNLKLKENSKSEDIYEITNEIGYRLPENYEVVPERLVHVDSFGGILHQLRLIKKEGKQFYDVLEEPNQQQKAAAEQEKKKEAGIWGTITNLWDGENNVNNPNTFGTQVHNETVNVFSLASGHLYERFLKIMFLSVRKHTNNPVKFWLLANFLSPKFKDSVPALAKKYNFDFEFVTYKWPYWLFKQTEKQRLIWAYKILFLDVLFPLDLKKVIYVDADQVVRADLNELLHFDLEGAPYAYTPFCDSNPSTEGFRFWKHGFWDSHLRGLPYHISALYLVDLQKFRQTAAGDNLRATYQNLAPDPNSLSNLDQDLPNYLQHMVRIKSLPQEWLWCETWCSQETKSKAKTIDLCNNPLTKTPKLENAVKIIDEWTALDNEAKEAEK